jgi:hypothetical protein
MDTNSEDMGLDRMVGRSTLAHTNRNCVRYPSV